VTRRTLKFDLSHKRLKQQIGLGMHRYHDARETFPPVQVTNAQGELLSN
jgi:hypothetical protein